MPKSGFSLVLTVKNSLGVNRQSNQLRNFCVNQQSNRQTFRFLILKASHKATLNFLLF